MTKNIDNNIKIDTNINDLKIDTNMKNLKIDTNMKNLKIDTNMKNLKIDTNINDLKMDTNKIKTDACNSCPRGCNALRCVDTVTYQNRENIHFNNCIDQKSAYSNDCIDQKSADCIDEPASLGYCGVPQYPKLAKAFLHMWEEPCISGTNGSGTVFFSGCNLKCVFCQNYDISQKHFGKVISIERLQQIYLELIAKGAHNINLVNPSHYVEVIRQSILPLKNGLISTSTTDTDTTDTENTTNTENTTDTENTTNTENTTDTENITNTQNTTDTKNTHSTHKADNTSKECVRLTVPVVYNTNGYDTVEAIQSLKGIVDVYLPDLKYFSKETAQKYSAAANYPEISQKAILEMYKQVGQPIFDKEGMIKSGLIVRHLILPGHVQESINILNWISDNLPKSVYVSLMSQYTPYYHADQYPEINRPITRREYERVVNHLYKLGLENGYVQERQSADEEYIPDFNLEGI